MTLDRVARLAPAGSGAVRSDRGVVASAFPEATDAGVAMLASGGNAVDAACAVGLALGVCEPQASGLGGQSVGVVHLDGRTFAIDGSSRVPSLAHHERFERGQRRTGHRAATVPSTIATYGWLHRRYGRLPWSEVVAPATRVAVEGYRITQLQHDLQARELDRLLSVPNRSGARYFLDGGVQPFAVGARFRQPDLARVLDEIARGGPEAFYLGEIAAQIDADMRANDGFLRSEDLALIPWPIERRCLRRRYRDVMLASMPPPGAGRVLLLTMMMLERIDPTFLVSEGAERVHFVAEVFRKAFLQRLDRPYDPNTYPQIPDKVLLSRRFAARLTRSIRDTIDPSLPFVEFDDVDDESELDGLADRGETTHFSVMDGDGNAVAMTQSIELVYGAKAAADGLGFLYNCYILALDRKDPTHPYFHRPNAVPWSTAAPTIVFRGGRPWLALGSPGSERIYSAVAQVLMHTIDGGAALDAAIAAPRLHCSVGGKVSLEAERFAPEVAEHLVRTGYVVDRRSPFDFYLGCVQAVGREDGSFVGAADPRRDGTAAGP